LVIFRDPFVNELRVLPFTAVYMLYVLRDILHNLIKILLPT